MTLRPVYQNIKINPIFPIRSVFMETTKDKDLFYCHWHHNIEFIYVLEGSIDMKIDSEEFILTKGDICIVNPNQIHYGNSRNNNFAKVHLVVLSYDILGLNSDDIIYKKYVRKLKEGNIYFPNIIPKISVDSDKWIMDSHKYIQKLLSINRLKYEGIEIDIQAYLLLLISTLFKENKFINNKMEYRESNKDHAILTYMENHFSENITIMELSKEFGFSVDYFTKYFKKLTGKTPVNYIQNLKVSYSKELLAKTDLNISEIGYKVGFDSTSYFCKVFKKYTSKSPNEFRKKYFYSNAI